MKKLLTSISLCAFVLSANAQLKADNALPSLSRSDVTVVERISDGTIKYVRYAATDDNIPANAEEFFTTTLKKRNADDFVMDRSDDTDNGMHFECYQQYYQGVPVDDGFYNFRFKNGRMKGVKGHYVSVTDVNHVPSITEKEAVDIYANSFGIKKENVIRSYVKLMIKEIPNADSQGSLTALVYKVFLYAASASNEYVGYIDAHSGMLLYKENAAVSSSAGGHFYTYYNSSSNPKFGITEYANNIYTLTDNYRVNGINTIKDNQNGNTSPFTDSNNIWEQSELWEYGIALDVHWTMEQIGDLMYGTFGHNSYDNGNHSILSIINTESRGKFYPTGDIFTFGIASGSTKYGPFGSVDIIGHEYGHAILYKSSGFNSSGDTKAAIHEGLADIWAIIIEKHITPSANYWKLGEQIMINGSSCIRNFQSPNDATAYTQISSTYGCGLFNSTDPHIKGGLLPHWFYLLVKGGSGTNELNNSYQILPLGFDLAEQLIYKTTSVSGYLQGCTSFYDVANAFIDAAEDNYNDFTVEQVRNAFYAVGLSYEPQHIYTQSYSPGSATYYVYGNSNCSVSWSYTHSSGNLPSLIPNYSNHTCTVNTSSSFTGYLNATILCGGCSATYSRYITGTASPSSAGGDVMQVIPIDGSHYQISAGSGYESASIRVYDASSLQMKVAETQISDNYVLDTSSWKHGLYIVEMTIGNKTYTTKLVVR